MTSYPPREYQPSPPRVLLLDNHDSFTFNVVQALRVLGAQVTVDTNDRFDPATLEDLDPTHVVVAPGPGRPAHAGCTPDLLRRAVDACLPVLGICLGHQAIGEHFGARIAHARELIHGKESSIHHDRQGLFEGLPNPLRAARYHSLVVDPATVPDELVVSAFTSDGEVMGLRHRELPVAGVQFHPESILTPQGIALLQNFLELETSARRVA